MRTIGAVAVQQSAGLLCVLLVCLSCGALRAEDDGWNLPAAERVAEAEAAAARADIAVAQRVLQQLQAGAKAAGTLAERATAEAQVNRVRLALGRACTRADRWEEALPLLTAIPLEGKSIGVQRAICAALLDALAPLLWKPDGRVVTPWTPVANDRYGPLQPDSALRAPYTRTDRRQAVTHICSALAAWERLAGQDKGLLTDSERATVAALDTATAALVRYAWGLDSLERAAGVVESLPAAQRRTQTLRLARLLLDERDLKHAVPYLLALERTPPKDEIAKAAAEELLRIYCAHERLKTSLPMWDPGVEEAVRPYLKDPAWAQTRETILRELDKAIGAVDLRVVLGEPEGVTPAHSRGARLESKFDTPPSDPASKEASDIVVPPDILAKAELGDHWEGLDLDRTDMHVFVSNAEADKEPQTDKDKEQLAEAQKLKKELAKLAGEKPNRYKKLGFLAGVLRKNILLTLDPKLAGQREVREEYELQVDHQEFMIEALGPSWQKDTSKGFRPLTPDSPLRLVVLTRYHGSVDLEARRLPDRGAYEKMDGGLTPQQAEKLPVVKTFSLPLPPLWTNLDPDATKRLLDVKDHGLTPGFYVLLARARYSPVVAVTRLAIADTKLVVRHAPAEVLIWTLERLTGAPRPATKLAGDITLEYVAETAWGDAPLPSRAVAQSARLRREGEGQGEAGTGTTPHGAPPRTGLTWEPAGFLAGFGDALNNRAHQLGDDSYLAGVAEGKKQLARFPPQALTLPAESDANGLVRIGLPPNWSGHRCRIRAVANGCEVDAVETWQDLQAEKTERIVEWVADRPVVRPGQTV
ncbi:MAG: hypothetical protein NTW87_35895, partial [Planctomycetota bacterium]|nr:hypothetical protein [Planctomycetota bacterium]